MIYQANLFNSSVIVERELTNGTVVRLLLEPVEPRQVRVLEYYRLTPKSNRFKRLAAEEGKVLEFSQLRLSLAYRDLF